eukprot:COSAG03_NODE_3528_length_1967_cov_33.972698_1_plen_35_part_10
MPACAARYSAVLISTSLDAALFATNVWVREEYTHT